MSSPPGAGGDALPGEPGPWWRLVCDRPDETAAAGEALARWLRAGDVVTVRGPLGAGKTVFVRGLARGLGIPPEEVTSPTFVYVRELRGGRLPLFHVDAYRLVGRPAEAADGGGALIEELGLDHYLGGGGVVAVEWPQPLEHLLGEARVEVELAVPAGAPSERRELYLRGRGQRLAQAVAEVAGELGGAPSGEPEGT